MPPFPSVFDSTMLSTAKACRRKFWLQYLNHWKPLGTSIHLRAGGAFAAGLEAGRRATWERGVSPPDAEAEAAMALLQAYGPNDQPDHAKSLLGMLGALDYYFEAFPLAETVPILLASGGRAIEMSFVEPLPDATHPETGEPILLCGRADAIVEWAGASWLLDDKTTGSLGASWANQWELRSQFSAYTWLAQQAGFPVQGTLVRGISILKTKYDHQQVPTYRPAWRVAEWLATTQDLIADLIADWRDQSWRPNLDESCNSWGGCPFRQVCLSEDHDPWLHQYFERRRWDPIHRTEELLP